MMKLLIKLKTISSCPTQLTNKYNCYYLDKNLFIIKVKAYNN